ncbi:larval cuticle protein 9 [Drosophila grimshawi]|uniref:GH21539 n=1 Tax=Drosophila grimshawi TaxID=7222 RepID=B4J4D6_DROGR|nr:larval cuticle protein 9 [Drosophila grimshawi]EDW01618.1 GH21539 [Drosophila grimshawi]
MKFVIVLACLLAVAYANDAVVTKEFSEVNPDSFKYEVETSEGIKVAQSGHLKDPETIAVEGSYEYVSKEGKHVKVTYTADELGYHPEVSQS